MPNNTSDRDPAVRALHKQYEAEHRERMAERKARIPDDHSSYIMVGNHQNLTRYAGWAISQADQWRAIARGMARLMEQAADLVADYPKLVGVELRTDEVMPDVTDELRGDALHTIHTAMDMAAATAAMLEYDAMKAEVNREHFAVAREQRATKAGRTRRTRRNRRTVAPVHPTAPALQPAA